jgi:hypothetical protein
MGTLTDRERALRIRLATDFEAYARVCLKIRTKEGSVTPFNINRSQLFLHEKLEEQRRTKGKVRALVLKGRQVGISTYISARYYWRTTHSRGCRTFILAHLDDASANLFTMAKRFHENVPELFRPETGSSNAKELAFSGLDSGYKVATAGSQAVGRSDTIQFFHGSEMAFWPNAEEHSAGIGQAIADSPGTEDVRESTANGIGNAFHSLWKAAERGDSDFAAIFIPWFWHEPYTKTPPDDWSPPEALLAYEQAYNLKRGQTYWAYCKNRDLSAVAGGSADEINWKFRQEYPANADEAFQTSGADAFIAPDTVLKARKAAVTGYGAIILGVDPARGGGDKTGIIDRQGRRLGGNICKRIDQNDLMSVAGEIQRIVKEIKPAKVVIDTTGLGAGLYDRLRELLGDLIEGVNFGSKAFENQKYVNRRAEMWDLMRAWFDDVAGVQVPDDDAFQGDVCSIIRGQGATRFDSSGRLILEPKEHVKERLSFSPDIGDAAALTFAIDMTETPSTLEWTPRVIKDWKGI